MSEMAPHNLECPNCGNKQETMVWNSINVTLDPELKRTLLEAKINLFSCEKCGENSFTDTPLLYHDMAQQFCVQSYPVEAIEDVEFLRRFSRDGSVVITGIPAGIKESGAYITCPHIVFDINEMLRYVRFRDRISESTREIASKKIRSVPPTRRSRKR